MEPNMNISLDRIKVYVLMLLLSVVVVIAAADDVAIIVKTSLAVIEMTAFPCSKKSLNEHDAIVLLSQQISAAVINCCHCLFTFSMKPDSV